MPRSSVTLGREPMNWAAAGPGPRRSLRSSNPLSMYRIPSLRTQRGEIKPLELSGFFRGLCRIPYSAAGVRGHSAPHVRLRVFQERGNAPPDGSHRAHGRGCFNAPGIQTSANQLRSVILSLGAIIALAVSIAVWPGGDFAQRQEPHCNCSGWSSVGLAVRRASIRRGPLCGGRPGGFLRVPLSPCCGRANATRTDPESELLVLGNPLGDTPDAERRSRRLGKTVRRMRSVIYTGGLPRKELLMSRPIDTPSCTSPLTDL